MKLKGDLTVEQKRDLVRLLAQKRKLQDELRIETYLPLRGGQNQFHRSKARIRGISGGNQSGKTTAIAVESIWYSLGIHPYRKVKVPNVGRVVSGSNFDEGIGQTLWPKFKEWIPPRSVKHISYYKNDIVKRVDWVCGSRTHFMCAEQKDMVFESATIDWAAFDEPMRKAIFDATMRGLLKSRGPLWWAFTPLTEPWMYYSIIQPALEGQANKGVWMLDTYDNCIDKGGYLPRESIEEFENELTDEDKEVRIHGRPRFLTGRIYSSFDKEKHIIDDFEFSTAWPMYEGFDPHQGKPHAWMQVVITPDDDLVIVDELFLDVGIPDFADKILERRTFANGVQKNILNCVMDVPGKIKDWSRTTSPYQIFQEKGISVVIPPKVNRKDDWINSIQYMLEHGKIKVLRRCKRVATEFENYRRDPKGRLVKNFDDMMDILGYIITMNPRFQYQPEIITYRREDVY